MLHSKLTELLPAGWTVKDAAPVFPIGPAYKRPILGDNEEMH